MFGLSNSYSLQTRWLGYASGKGPVRRVIVIVALAEELLVLLVTSLLEVSVSSTEMAVSLSPNRTTLVSRTTMIVERTASTLTPFLNGLYINATPNRIFNKLKK